MGDFTSDLWFSTGLYFGSFSVFSIHALSWCILSFLCGRRWNLYSNQEKQPCSDEFYPAMPRRD